MSAVDEELGLAGLKSYVALPGGVPFVVVLFDLERAELAAVIEADRMGQLRTGAASGVAAKHLAKPEARTLGIIGCGWQAESQVACIRAALPSIEQVVAYCRTEKSLLAFCDKVGAEPGESHRDPAQQDVVVTVTTSDDPVLRGEWLQPGALVCAVGANRPKARELDNVVLERAVLVCCDSIEQAKIESGDLIEPVDRGVLDWLEVHELHEVVSGELPGRSSPDDIVALQVERARRLGRRHRRRRDRAGEEEEAREAALSTSGANAGHDVVAERPDQLRPIQKPLHLLRRAPVAHVRVLEDLGQRAPALVLADDVRGDPVLLARPSEEKRERIPEKSREPRHRDDCILAPCASCRPPRGSRSASCTGSTSPGPRSASSSGSSARRADCGLSAVP